MLKSKKAFTLVELLVVIAILSILASVSVIRYSSFIQKGHESNEINAAKRMTEAVKDYAFQNEVKSKEDVLKALRVANLLIDLDICSEGYSFVWDSSTNTILYIHNEDNKVIGHTGNYGDVKYWVIIK